MRRTICALVVLCIAAGAMGQSGSRHVGVKVDSTEIYQMGAASGQVLKWDGTYWLPATDDTASAVGSGDNARYDTTAGAGGVGDLGSPFWIQAGSNITLSVDNDTISISGAAGDTVTAYRAAIGDSLQEHWAIFIADNNDTVTAYRPAIFDSLQVHWAAFIADANDTVTAYRAAVYDSIQAHWAAFIADNNDTVTAYRLAIYDSLQVHWATFITDNNTQLTQEQVEDYAGAMVTGNTETGIVVAYQDGDGTIDFTVSGVDSSHIADYGISGVDIDTNGASDGQVLKWSTASGRWVASADATGGGGTPNILDLGDDASNESTDLIEIATTGDANSIFTEPSADKLRIAVGNNWPTADSSTAVDTSYAPLRSMRSHVDALQADTSMWSLAHSWGDHSTQNYLDDDITDDVDDADIDWGSGAGQVDTDDIPEGSNLYNQTHTGDVTGATALSVGSQKVKGDHVDSTSEPFAFSSAYHITTATGDSAYMSKAYIDGVAGAAGDITSVGDVTAGAAFDGTQGTTLTFFDAQGNGTLTIADLSTARTYTLPDASGTFTLLGNATSGSGGTIALTTNPSFGGLTTSSITLSSPWRISSGGIIVFDPSGDGVGDMFWYADAVTDTPDSLKFSKSGWYLGGPVMATADSSIDFLHTDVKVGGVSVLTSEAGDVASVTAGAGMTGTSETGPDVTLNVIAGTGITVNANDIEATLGTAIVTGEITDGTILEADLNANAPTAEYILTYQSSDGTFQWESPDSLDVDVNDLDAADDYRIYYSDASGLVLLRYDLDSGKVLMSHGTDSVSFETAPSGLFSSNEDVEDVVGAMVSGNVEIGINVAYIDNGAGAGKLDAVIDTTADFTWTGTHGFTGATVNLPTGAVNAGTEISNQIIQNTHFVGTANWGDVSTDAGSGVYINANAVSADELNATGVEAELEAVLDLNELQGTIGDAQIAAAAVDGGAAGEIADNTIDNNDIVNTLNLGGDTSFEIPNSTGPATTVEGQIAYDTDADALEVYDGSTSRLMPVIKHFHATIFDPDGIQATEDAIPLLAVEVEWAPNGITLVDLGIKTDASSTYAVNFEEWTSPTSAMVNAIEPVTTSASTEAEDDGTLTTSAIPAGSIIYIDLPATDINMLTIWGTYYVDAD